MTAPSSSSSRSPSRLGSRGQLTERDPAKTAEMLIQIETETQTALEDLRDLARGIYPPLLADRGLVAALEAQSRKAAVPVSVEADAVGRYSVDVEATVYFCALEALQNVAKYADADRTVIRLSQSNGSLSFEVVDEGRGFDPDAVATGSGLQGMADRLAAVGGSLEIRSAPGQRHHGGGPCAGHRCLISEGNDRGDGIHVRTGASRGRLAFRIVGWVFGVLTIGYSLFLVVVVDRVQRSSRTRSTVSTSSAGLAGGGLIGVFSIALGDATGLDVCLPRPRRPGDRVDDRRVDGW